MAKGYISNRQQNLKIGISSYTENDTVLQVTGKVGINTDNATSDLDINGTFNVSGVSTFKKDVHFDGALYDSNNQSGAIGQVLVSTASGTDWQNIDSIETIQTIINTSLTGIGIKEEGVGIGTTFTSINFVGSGVTAIANGTTANITFSQQVGPQGVQGAKGDQGVQGAKGDQGDQGVQGAKGDQGDQGVQGAKGDQGDQGVQGAKGDKGDQGVQGAKGDKGDQGDQGVQGAKGDQGDQGVQGAKGDKGDQGDQGVQGAKGDKGDQGDQGVQGAKGDKGDKGDQGDQGVQGATGSFSGTFTTNTWYNSSDSRNRFYFTNLSHTYIKSSSNIYLRTANNDTDNCFVSSGSLTAINVNSTSDEKLKDNIKTIENALKKVLSLRGTEYDRNDLEGKPHQIGLIAQEVEKIIPEVISESEDGIKNVAYGNLTALLIEAIKEQQKQINTMEQEIKNLK